MPSTTSLFNGFLGDFPELSTELAQYIDTLKKTTGDDTLQAAVEAALKAEQKDKAMDLLIQNCTALNSAPEKNIIPAYNLLLLLASQSPKPDTYLSQICQQLSSNPVTTTPHGAGLSLTILSTVFNIIPADSVGRYHVLQAILNVVRSSSSFEAIRPQLDSIESWLGSWKLDDNKKRELYIQISDVAKDAGEESIAYRFTITALRTFNADTASSADSEKLALVALKAALENPSHFDFQDLTSLDAIQALSKSNPEQFELLELFTSESLEEFNDFKSEHEGWIEKSGLNKTALDRKMRLLTLASLAAGSGQSRSLPYEKIAKALEIPVEDVELWVIDVIRAGLVEGKLSQLNKTFLIHRSTYRVFGENQWREIASRLDMWKRSLTGVLGVITQEKSAFTATKEQEQKEIEAKLNGGNQGGRGDYRSRQQQQPRPQEIEAAE